MKTLPALAISAFLPVFGLHAAEPLVWTINAAGTGPTVNPLMHGIFFEDINYAADGGLYAELVENRSFEHKNGMHGWTEAKRGSAAGNLSLEADQPIHANNPRFLRMKVVTAGDGW